MYGPNLKVSVSESVILEEPTFFPAGTWCSLAILNKGSDCFTLDKSSVVEKPQDFVYMTQGSIIPMTALPRDQNSIYKMVDVSPRIDLHILPDYSDPSFKASGELVIDDIVAPNRKTEFCYFKFDLYFDTITFTDVSVERGASQSCTSTYAYIGDVIIYSRDLTKVYTKAKFLGDNSTVLKQLDMVKMKNAEAYRTENSGLFYIYSVTKIVFTEQ